MKNVYFILVSWRFVLIIDTVKILNYEIQTMIKKDVKNCSVYFFSKLSIFFILVESR